MEKNYWIISHTWEGATDEKVEDYHIPLCLENNFICCQYEYCYQHKPSVSERWRKLKSIKVGDVIILRGKNKIYAWGYAIAPRFDNGASKVIQNCDRIMRSKNHGQYRSGGNAKNRFQGYVEFDDCETFYEYLGNNDFKNGVWGQRVDVDEWRNIKENGIYEIGGPPLFGTKITAIKPISEEASKYIIEKLGGIIYD